MPPKRSWVLPLTSVGRPARSELKRSMRRSSSGSTLYLTASIRNSRCSSASLSGLLGGDVVRLRPVVGPVELPHVVVEGRQLGAGDPRRAVAGHCGPALVVDAAVAEHLEVLELVLLGRRRVVEAVPHARTRACGFCWMPLTKLGAGKPGGLEDGRRDVDHVGELRADLALGREAVRPVHDRCRCGCRPSARRPAWSTGTACPSRAPSRPRSGCTRGRAELVDRGPPSTRRSRTRRRR